jgi:lanthanide-dependent methanol dehydrogenase
VEAGWTGLADDNPRVVAHPSANHRAQWKLLKANKFDPSINWAEKIDLQTGRPVLNDAKMTKEDVNVKDICPAAQGDKYRSGFPYVGATLSMCPADGGLLFYGTLGIAVLSAGIEYRAIAIFRGSGPSRSRSRSRSDRYRGADGKARSLARAFRKRRDRQW